MPELIQRILEPQPGTRSRLAGLFLAQLDDQSRRLTEDTRGATPEELAWQPAPGMNTIGMLLAHIATVEVAWVGRAVLGTPWERIDELALTWSDVGVPLPPGGTPPAALAGRDLAYFDDLLAGARAYTKRAVVPLEEAELDRRIRVARGPDREIELTIGWVLYHALEHEAGHYYQINLLRHQYRLALSGG